MEQEGIMKSGHGRTAPDPRFACDKTRLWWLLPAFSLVLTLALSPAAEALSVSTSAVSFPGTTLDGSDQVLTGSTAAWRIDAAGQTTGWNLTVAATDFASGPNTIAVSNLDARLFDSSIILVSGDPNGPVSSLTAFGPLSGTPVKIATAASGEGDGVYDATPDFRLDLPAETYAGSYTATLTVDVVSGP